MPFIELIYNIANLNFEWLIGLATGNLFWIFVFYAAGNFFSGGKSPLKRGAVMFILVWTSMDLFRLTGFTIFTAAGLSLMYFMRMPVLLFLEKSTGLGKFIPLAWTATFYIAITWVAFGG